MVRSIMRLVFKLSNFVASIALLLAVTSVSNTCCFMSYQPDLPEELNL